MTQTFERRLSALSAPGSRASLHGGRRGIEKESLRVTPDGYIAQYGSSALPRIGSRESFHHDRLLGSVARVRDAARRGDVGSDSVFVRHSSVRIRVSRRGVAVGDEHAVHDPLGRRRSAGALRVVQRRHDENRLSPWSRLPLRAQHAGDIGRTFQLFVTGPVLAGVPGGRGLLRQRGRVPLSGLPGAGAQRAAAGLAAVVSVRRVSRGL